MILQTLVLVRPTFRLVVDAFFTAVALDGERDFLPFGDTTGLTFGGRPLLLAISLIPVSSPLFASPGLEDRAPEVVDAVSAVSSAASPSSSSAMTVAP